MRRRESYFEVVENRCSPGELGLLLRRAVGMIIKMDDSVRDKRRAMQAKCTALIEALQKMEE